MKKIISVLLSMIMLFSISALSVQVNAYDAEESVVFAQIEPRFQYADSATAGITKGSLGFVTCLSQCTILAKGVNVTLTCTLQRTDGSEAWANYKSTSITFASPDMRSIEKSWFAPAGYAYRTYTKMQIKNSAGTVLETVTVASNVLYK